METDPTKKVVSEESTERRILIPGEKDYSDPKNLQGVNMEVPDEILYRRMEEYDIETRKLFDEFYEKEKVGRQHPRAMIELAQEYLPKIAEARKRRDEAFDAYKERLLMHIEYNPLYSGWAKQLEQK